MGSPSLIIVSILIVWVIVLAPLAVGNNKPIRRSGEGYEETRVLHQGGNAPMAMRRRPKLTKADVHRHSEDDDYEVVEAVADDEQVLIDDAPDLRIFKPARRDDVDDTAEDDTTVDGEVIEHETDEAAGEDAQAGSTKVIAAEAGGSTAISVSAAEESSDDDEDASEGGAVEWESASDDSSDDEVPEAGIRYGDSDLELVLPSGARLGHRSLQRYYRQTLWQTPASQARAPTASNGRALAHRLAGSDRIVRGDLVVGDRGGHEVVARNRGEAKEAQRHIREFRDVQRREQFKTKVGFRHNNQKHFRDPLLQ